MSLQYINVFSLSHLISTFLGIFLQYINVFSSFRHQVHHYSPWAPSFFIFQWIVPRFDSTRLWQIQDRSGYAFKQLILFLVLLFQRCTQFLPIC
jgi:hypothetical protein